MNEKYTDVCNLEEKIFVFEEIRVVIRAPIGAKVKDYPYERKAKFDMTIGDWIDTRVKPLIGDLDIDVICGNGNIARQGMCIETVRGGYNLNN